MRAPPAGGPCGHHEPLAPPPAARRAPAAGPRPGTCSQTARQPALPSLKVGGSEEATRGLRRGDLRGPALNADVSGARRVHPLRGAPPRQPASPSLGPLLCPTPSPGHCRGRGCLGARWTWCALLICMQPQTCSAPQPGDLMRPPGHLFLSEGPCVPA
ncbi:vascular endothelial growth factor B isoform X9 [Callithrix jacchus]